MKNTYLKTSLVATDTLDSDNTYYLYEIETETSHYYYSTSDYELNESNTKPFEFVSNKLIERKDMSDNEWNIAKVLFWFLWNSENGTNTCMDYEQLEEENITKEDIEKFIEKFDLDDCLDIYEEDGVEIYWEFLCRFDLKTCKFFKE